jgi:Replication initiation factor
MELPERRQGAEPNADTSVIPPRYLIEQVTAGIDYLTATLPQAAGTGDLWVEHCLKTLDTISKEGYELRERTLLGYYGVSAGNCFVGSRDDTHIVQFTGAHANDWFTSIYRPDLHVSRIDVQTTVRYEVMPLNVARSGYNGCQTANAGLHLPKRRKLVLITGSDGGDTLYIGAPSSDQRGRIYNKEVQSESPEFVRTWRFEVVFRNDLASSIAGQCPYPFPTRAEWAKNICYEWFTSRGVQDLAFRGQVDCLLPLNHTRPSDVERKLHWIEHQVAPTVRFLTEHGYGDTIKSLLGFTTQPD